MGRRVHVIGAGFSGLSAACYAAKDGHEVTVVEKNHQVGGRARQFSHEGFTFDMGPSWYWMPDVFDSFFADFGRTAAQFYQLKKLDPGFVIHFEDGDLPVHADLESLYAEIERLEPGASDAFRKFLQEAEEKYRISMSDFVYRASDSIWEFVDPRLILPALKLSLFSSVAKTVRTKFKDPKIRHLLEFPVLFLGQTAEKIPAMYTMMNHAGITQGTFYPMGGMHVVPQAMKKVAQDLGVKFLLEEEVNDVNIINNEITAITTSSGTYNTEAVIASTDYHHFEQNILPKEYRRYSEEYWDKRTLAPSCLLYYLGVNKKIQKLPHHILFFDADLAVHSETIYETKKWPDRPLFYACTASKTDESVAPSGCENLFLLIPIAPGINYTEDLLESYYLKMMTRLEHYCGQSIKEHVVFKRSYCIKDFEEDYHAYKGNAYGLANTLEQTAFLKPKMRSKVKNLIFTGQLTVPGPGVPPSIISGKIAAQLIKN